MQELLQKMLQEQLKNQVNQQLAKSLSVSESQAQDMVDNSLPYLLGGLKKNASTKDGAADLLKALQSGKHDGDALEKAEELAQNPEAGEGKGILKHILGSKEEAAEAQVAKEAGVEPEQAKKTMMVLAPMIMAALGKVVKSDQLNADKLSVIVSDLAKNKDLGGAGQKIAMQLLDKDGDGDVKDDFIRIGKNWLGTKFGKK